MLKYYDFSYDSKLWEYHTVSKLIICNTPHPNGRVLALGAGFEPVSTVLFYCGFNVLHTDYNIHLCDRIEIFGKLSSIIFNIQGHIQIAKEDMRTIDNCGTEYDTIYHISSFEHLNQQERISCLNNSIRVLKKNGLIIFTADALLKPAGENKGKDRVPDRLTILDIKDILNHLYEQHCKPIGEVDITSFEDWAEVHKDRLYLRTLDWPGTIHNGDVLMPVLFAFRTP